MPGPDRSGVERGYSKLPEGSGVASSPFDLGESNRISEDYVLALGFFASVLFFAGISTKFDALSARFVTLTLGVFLVVGIIHFVETPNLMTAISS